MVKRKVLSKITPDVVIVVDGNNIKIETITSVKTINVEFEGYEETTKKLIPTNTNLHQRTETSHVRSLLVCLIR